MTIIKNDPKDLLYVLTSKGWRCNNKSHYGIGDSKEEALKALYDISKRKPTSNISVK